MKIYILIVFTLFYSLVIGQKTIEERLLEAESKSKLHPKDDFIISNYLTKVNFTLDKNQNTDQLLGDGPIGANIEEKILFYNLKNYRSHSEAIFYSGESTISELQKYEIINGKLESEFVQVNSYDYNSQEMFHHDVKVKSFSLLFNLAGQEMGYGYKESIEDVKYLKGIYFNADFFTENREVVVDVPSWLSLEIKEYNFEGFGIIKKEEPYEGGKKIRFYTNNIEGYPEEKFAIGHAHTFPHILFAIKSYKFKDAEYRVFEDVSDLYAWYGSLAKSCDNQGEKLIAIGKELCAGKSEIDQIKSIYYWVQDNIRYIAFEDGLAGFKPEDAHNVFTNRYGDCKGMANLLKTMLTNAGFDAHLTWIGTSSKPYDYSFPSLYIDNHMICTLNFQGKEYFLDGTENYQSFGVNAHRIRGKELMIENGSKYTISKVPIGLKSDLDSVNFQLNLLGDKLEGTSNLLLKGDNKVQFMNYFFGINTSDRNTLVGQWLKSDNKNLQVLDFDCVNCDNRDKAIFIKYKVVIDNMVFVNGKETFLSFNLGDDYTFFEKEEKRKSAIDFEQQVNNSRTFEIKLSGNYAVKSLPKPLDIKNKEFSIVAWVQKTGDKLTIHRKVEVYNGTISLAGIDAWVAATKQLDGFMNNQIILTK